MNPLAVIDVETTGLNYHQDRIVEIAVVLLFPGQGIAREFETILNPDRDIGPTSIHGLTASDVVTAPRFSDIVGNLAGLLCGAAAIVGHNIRFDVSFLRSEFQRINIDMPGYEIIDTMNYAGGRTLFECCKKYGVDFDGVEHAALNDARATAGLLAEILSQNPEILDPFEECESYSWPNYPQSCEKLLTRNSLKNIRPVLPRYIQQLAGKLTFGSMEITCPEGEKCYRSLLWRVLEDGRIDETEQDSLVKAATQ